MSWLSVLPSWILWLSPVVVMPLLALLWISVASRPRGPVPASSSVQKHEAFRRAMEAPAPAQRPGRTRTPR